MRKEDHLKYYLEKFAFKLQKFITYVISAISFCMIPVYLGYIIYYSMYFYHPSKVISGCISLCVMIHLNKSL